MIMADRLEVLSARAVKSAVNAIAQDFMRRNDCIVAIDFAPVGAIEKKLAAGAFADAVILSDAAIDALEKAGKLRGGSRRPLGRTSIGVCVREGAVLPDISTPETFRALLLSAEKISLSDVAVGGTAARYLPGLFERMGLAQILEPKLVRCAGGDDVAQRVVRGEAAIGITFISEILAIRGARVVGALPAIYGNDTAYVAAIMRAARQPDIAQRFTGSLVRPSAREAWRRAGFRPSIEPSTP